MTVGLCQGRETPSLRTLVTFVTAHCSDINAVCLKDLTFLFNLNKSQQLAHETDETVHSVRIVRATGKLALRLPCMCQMGQ